jgi:hypothetical protein
MTDIAFLPFIRLDEGPLHYFSVLGRALYAAQHLEMNCRGVAVFLHLKTTIAKGQSSLDDPVFQRDIGKMWNRTLGQNIHHLEQAGIPEHLQTTLDKARDSRNEIAHSIAMGINESLDGELEHRIAEIVALVRNIASADKAMATLVHVLNKDSLPTAAFLKDYEDRVVRWVVEPTHE